jgi:hypothetical protein
MTNGVCAAKPPKEGVMSESRPIKPSEQQCIGDCIRRFWGEQAEPTDPIVRDQSYEQCLTDCRICA